MENETIQRSHKIECFVDWDGYWYFPENPFKASDHKKHTFETPWWRARCPFDRFFSCMTGRSNIAKAFQKIVFRERMSHGK